MIFVGFLLYLGVVVLFVVDVGLCCWISVLYLYWVWSVFLFWKVVVGWVVCWVGFGVVGGVLVEEFVLGLCCGVGLGSWRCCL